MLKTKSARLSDAILPLQTEPKKEEWTDPKGPSEASFRASGTPEASL